MKLKSDRQSQPTSAKPTNPVTVALWTALNCAGLLWKKSVSSFSTSSSEGVSQKHASVVRESPIQPTWAAESGSAQSISPRRISCLLHK
ncbi:hypothetical protein MHYP_G00193420 [Metynnis hypsauchen]